MAKIVVMAGAKGGIGRSSITELINEYEAIIKIRTVLSMMFDTQGGAHIKHLPMNIDSVTAERLIPEHPQGGLHSTGDIFSDKIPLPHPTAFDNLDVLPPVKSLLREHKSHNKGDILKQKRQLIHYILKIQEYRKEHGKKPYDLVTIDTAPSFDDYTIVAIKSSTHLIVPFQPTDEDSVQGVLEATREFHLEAMHRPKEFPLNFVGMLPNKVKNRSREEKLKIKALQEDEIYGKHIFPTYLPDHKLLSKVKTDALERKSIFYYPKSNKSRQSAEEVCKYIDRRVFAE